MYSIFSGATHLKAKDLMSYANLEFISDRNAVLRALTASKEQGTAIGINSAVLGTGTYISCVEDIILDTDIVIVLKPYDATGHMLERAQLALSDIQSVLPFNSTFENPFFKDTQFHRSQQTG